MSVLDPRRLAMLDAMGIEVWSRRGASGAAADGAAFADDAVVDGDGPFDGAVPFERDAPFAGVVVSAGEVASGADTAVLDWEQLAARAAACTRCALHGGRTQTVFGTGNRGASWLVIGEAPGAEEDKRGEPFVGRAGQLLNSMLVAAGLTRESVYIANILKCRPPQNRDPKPEEVVACSAYLARQIELVSPRIILAVGRIAAQNLLKTETPIGRMRGRLHYYGPSSIPVVVTYHPAYLLRSPAEKRKAWDDLRLAMATVRAQAEAHA